MTIFFLFDGTLGTTPTVQGKLSKQQILPFPFAPFATETIINSGVTLNTNFNGDNSGYVGYTNYRINSLLPPSVDLVNLDFPLLNSETGFSVSFNFKINLETSLSNNRSGFSVVVVNSDGSNEIELGFNEDRIFAQTEEFIAGEEAKFTTTNATDYELQIKNNKYHLLANSTKILSGSLRNYNFDPSTSEPPLPFTPYDLSNFLFLGDNTDQASSTFTLNNLKVNDSSPICLDIDGDGQYLASLDGLLFYGYLNIRTLPPQLVNNLTQQLADSLINPNSGATRTTGAAISQYLETNQEMMDVDGDGEISASIDGLLCYGYLNIRTLPPQLVNNLTQQLADNLIPDNSGAIRTTGIAIASFLEEYMM